MAIDNQYDDEDEVREEMVAQAGKWNEFDCPTCNANNPTEPFTDGDHLTCNYCGEEFAVHALDGGRMKLRVV